MVGTNSLTEKSLHERLQVTLLMAFLCERRLWFYVTTTAQPLSMTKSKMRTHVPTAVVAVTRYRVVEVREPPAEEEGKTKECPICWDSFEACQDWRLFPCQHGTCKVCHQKLVNPPGKRSACPLCRLPLVEIIQPGEIPSGLQFAHLN